MKIELQILEGHEANWDTLEKTLNLDNLPSMEKETFLCLHDVKF